MPAHAAFPGANGRLFFAEEYVDTAPGDAGPSYGIWAARQGERAVVIAGGSEPTVSPDGRLLAYQSSEGGISVRRSRGSPRRVISRGFDFAPTWSPGGGTLAFIRMVRDAGLYLVSVREPSPRLLYAGAALSLAWSPTGDRLAVTVGEVDNPRLVEIARGDGAVRELGQGAEVTWSRAGWLGYTRGGNLYVTRSDASAERLVGSIDAAKGCPRYGWSPDGRRVVFTRSKQLVVFDTATQQLHRLQQTGRCPIFSPNGRRIAFHRRVGFTAGRIWTVPAKGGESRLYTRVPANPGGCEPGRCDVAVTQLDWQARPGAR